MKMLKLLKLCTMRGLLLSLVSFTVKEVIEMDEKVTGQSIKVIEADRRAGDPAVLIASSDKAKHIPGWESKHNSLKEIIETAWNWHQSHPNGYNIK